MYELIQVAAKVVIIAAILLVAVFASLKVWRADVDLRQLLSPRRMVERSVDDAVKWLPTREEDALYQGEKVVARVTGVAVDEQNGLIKFAEVYNSNPLDLKSEFEFRKWRLWYRGAKTITGLMVEQPQKGRIIEEAVCEILGERKPI